MRSGFSLNTLLRVKRSGSEIPGQVYDYRTLQEGAVSGQELDRWREETLDGPPGKCPRNLPRLVRFESPHIPRHSRAPDRRDKQIGKTRQLHGEKTVKSQEKYDKLRYSAIK